MRNYEIDLFEIRVDLPAKQHSVANIDRGSLALMAAEILCMAQRSGAMQRL